MSRTRAMSVPFLPGLLASALGLCLLAAPASAGSGIELKEGDAAAAFEGKDFINTDPVSLKSLRGRVVLLELFSTG